MTVNVDQTDSPVAEFSPEAWYDSQGDRAPLARQLVTVLGAQINERNALASRYLATQGDTSQLLQEVRESSVNPEIVERRNKAEQLLSVYNRLMAEMDELAKSELTAGQDEDPDALKAQLSELDKGIKAAFNFATPMFGEDINQVLPNLVPVKGTRQSSGSTGTGISRPRVNRIDVDGEVCSKTVKDKEGNDKLVSTFTVLSQAIGVPTTDLHNAWHGAAGTSDVPAGAVVEFSITDAKGQNRMVKVYNSG